MRSAYEFLNSNGFIDAETGKCFVRRETGGRKIDLEKLLTEFLQYKKITPSEMRELMAEEDSIFTPNDWLNGYLLGIDKANDVLTKG